MTTTHELKPCPLCGSKVRITETTVGTPYNNGSGVDCSAIIECACGLSFKREWTVCKAKGIKFFQNEDIYTAWNRRTDCILADGWIRPPCKIGDIVYYNDNNYSHKRDTLTFECMVSCFDFDHEAEEYIAVLNVLVAGHFFKRIGVKFSDFGQTVFSTKEEAKAVLKEK